MGTRGQPRTAADEDTGEHYGWRPRTAAMGMRGSQRRLPTRTQGNTTDGGQGRLRRGCGAAKDGCRRGHWGTLRMATKDDCDVDARAANDGCQRGHRGTLRAAAKDSCDGDAGQPKTAADEDEGRVPTAYFLMKRRVGFKGKRPEWAPKRARPWASASGTSKRMVMVLPGLMKRRGMGTSWRYP